MLKKNYILALTVALAGMYSCISKNIGVQTLPVEKQILPDRLPAPGSGLTRDFHTMKLKKIEGGLSFNGISENIKGSLAVYRDSLIVLSVVPVLGYELIRLLCTPDSVIVINRQDKSYWTSSFEAYRKKYGIPFDFYDLQAIVSNEIFYYDHELDGRSFRDSVNKEDSRNIYIIESFVQGRKITSQSLTLNAKEFTLSGITIADYDRRIRMDLVYDDFVQTEKDPFPMSLDFGLFTNGNSLEIDLHYGQVVFNDSLNVDFIAPASYTRKEI